MHRGQVLDVHQFWEVFPPFLFSLKLKMRIRNRAAEVREKTGTLHFLGWHFKSMTRCDDTGENFKGFSGWFFFDSIQGRFRWARGERKGDRPSPTQQLLDISSSLIPAPTEPGLGSGTESVPHLASSETSPVSTLSSTSEMPFLGAENQTQMLLPVQIQRRWQLRGSGRKVGKSSQETPVGGRVM